MQVANVSAMAVVQALAASGGAAFFWKVILPWVFAVVTDRRVQASIGVVTKVALIGTSVAASKIVEGLKAATAPESDGGSKVTRAELDAAIKAGTDEAIATIKRLGPDAWKQILAIYGGEDAVRTALATTILHKLGAQNVEAPAS